jgi:hypothetical protein
MDSFGRLGTNDSAGARSGQDQEFERTSGRAGLFAQRCDERADLRMGQSRV